MKINPDSLKPFLAEIIQAAVQKKEFFPESGLCLFSAMVGGDWNHGVLYVGRALNGWGEETLLRYADLDSSYDCQKVIEASLHESGWDQKESTCPCPILSLHNSWNDEHTYRPAKSQFWAVIRESMLALYGKQFGWLWHGHMAWTNLYKLSPKQGRNPSAKLMVAMRDASIAMLRQEIELLQPRVVVFLTGFDWWARPFIDVLGSVEDPGIISERHPKQTWHRGTLKCTSVEIPFIAVPHPERKARGPIIEAIVREMLPHMNGA